MADRGRPRGAVTPAEKRLGVVAIRLSAEMLATIDRMRSERLDHPDRSSYIRELIADAIEARGAAPGKAKRRS